MAIQLDLDINLQGNPISPGLAQGQAYFLDTVVKPRQVGVGNAGESVFEQSRFFKALKATKSELERINLTIKSGNDVGAGHRAGPCGKYLSWATLVTGSYMLETYNAILESASLQTKILEFINLGYQAESALKKVIEHYRISFSQIADIYLKSRLVDIVDVIERIVFYLQKVSSQFPNSYPHSLILILKTPSLLNDLNIPRQYLKGIICFEGSSHSHMAILARSLGIPAVFGINLKEDIVDSSPLLINGTLGTVCISPSKSSLANFNSKLTQNVTAQPLIDYPQSSFVPGLEPEPSSLFSYELGHTRYAYLPWLDQGIQEIQVPNLALELNSDIYSNIKQDLEQGAKGVGLYRSEVAFMLYDDFPTQEQLYSEYRLLLKSAAPYVVNIRTLDIGYDKPLAYFKSMSNERGLALMLTHPDIFETQLRAMFRASIGLNNLRILLPMVLSVAQLERALDFIQTVYNNLAKKYDIFFPKIGAMIEGLSAVDQIEDITQKVDFLSVGSNDLIYSILGTDRGAGQVGLGDGLDPQVLKILNIIVEMAHQYDKKVSICGEIAGDALVSIILLGLNFDTLSMDSRNLAKIKSILCQISKKDANKWVAEILAMDTASQVREYLTRVIPISF